MTLEQVKELRRLHEGYHMAVFRTEGIFHKENNQKAHILWDDSLEIGHYINVNANMHLYRDAKVTVDSFDYAAITGIYSDRNLEELIAFLDQMKAKGVLGDEEYKEIVSDYSF